MTTIRYRLPALAVATTLGTTPFLASGNTLSEGYVPSEQQQSALKDANSHLAKGRSSKAIETLKLAEIDVSMTVTLIPVAGSLKQVEAAGKLIGEKKYYEANMALKAVEDSMMIETCGIDSMPPQGDQAGAVKKSD